jgi:hypothetical protein
VIERAITLKRIVGILGLFIVVAVSGCQQKSTSLELSPDVPLGAEQSFELQVGAVKSGSADQIHVEADAIDEEKLHSIEGLKPLEVLLLDHPDNRITAEGIAIIAKLPNLVHLRLRGVLVDDQAARFIGRMHKLRVLNLPQSDITDSGLAELSTLTNLVQLRIGSSQLTDKGIQTLKHFPKLVRVHLIDVPITDQGLEVFEQMPQLESLYIDGAELSDSAYQKLFRAHPNLHVHVDQAHHDRDPHAHAH